jgi:site-specific recombinase XerD
MTLPGMPSTVSRSRWVKDNIIMSTYSAIAGSWPKSCTTRDGEGRFVFINERGQNMTDMGVRKMLRRVVATVPGLDKLAVHPDALRLCTNQ